MLRVQAVLQAVYMHVSRSLFDQDRLAFALHLLHSLSGALDTTSQSGAISSSEWDQLTGSGAAAVQANASSSGSAPHWVPSSSHAAIESLCAAVPQIGAAFDASNAAAWTTWLQSSESSLVPVCAQALRPIQQALITQALRPDRLHSALCAAAVAELAVPSLAPPAVDMPGLAEQCSTVGARAVLLLAGPGNDPSHELHEAALRCGPARTREFNSGTACHPHLHNDTTTNGAPSLASVAVCVLVARLLEIP